MTRATKKRSLLAMRRRLRKARRELRRLRRACVSLAIERQELDFYRWLIPRAQIKEEGGFVLDAIANQQQGPQKA